MEKNQNLQAGTSMPRNFFPKPSSTITARTMAEVVMELGKMTYEATSYGSQMGEMFEDSMRHVHRLEKANEDLIGRIKTADEMIAKYRTDLEDFKKESYRLAQIGQDLQRQHERMKRKHRKASKRKK